MGFSQRLITGTGARIQTWGPKGFKGWRLVPVGPSQASGRNPIAIAFREPALAGCFSGHIPTHSLLTSLDRCSSDFRRATQFISPLWFMRQRRSTLPRDDIAHLWADCLNDWSFDCCFLGNGGGRSRTAEAIKHKGRLAYLTNFRGLKRGLPAHRGQKTGRF